MKRCEQTTVDLVQYSYSLSYLQMGSCQLPVASMASMASMGSWQYGQFAACLNSHLKELANTNIFWLAFLGSIKPSFIGCLGMYVHVLVLVHCTYVQNFFSARHHPSLGARRRSFKFLNVSIKPIKQNCKFFFFFLIIDGP